MDVLGRHNAKLLERHGVLGVGNGADKVCCQLEHSCARGARTKDLLRVDLLPVLVRGLKSVLEGVGPETLLASSAGGGVDLRRGVIQFSRHCCVLLCSC